jgi:hypothetical protein
VAAVATTTQDCRTRVYAEPAAKQPASCLECRVIGFSVFQACGGYLLYHHSLVPVSKPGHRAMLLCVRPLFSLSCEPWVFLVPEGARALCAPTLFSLASDSQTLSLADRRVCAGGFSAMGMWRAIM